MRPMLGAHHEPPAIADDDDDDSDDADEAPRPAHHRKHHRKHLKKVEDERPTDDADDTDETPAPEPKADKPEPKKEVAAATVDDDSKDTSDLVTLFGPDSKEAAIVSEGKVGARAAPDAAVLDLGGRLLQLARHHVRPRSERDEQQSTSRRARIHGMQVSAEVFPSPLKKQDGGISGLGFSFNLAHSLGTTFTAMDDTRLRRLHVQPLAVGARRPLPLPDGHRHDRRRRHLRQRQRTRSSICRSRSRSPTPHTPTSPPARTSRSP